MFNQLIVFAFAFILSQGTDFAEPDIVTLVDGETYYLRAEYCEISNTEFRMSGRCWSLKGPGDTEYSVASSPGPTLKMIAGTTFSIVLQNNFVNSVQSEEDCHNSYCEMDKLNLHTHGLHISSSQDDVLVDLKPRISSSDVPNEYTYTYTIPEDHYPGIHWYHPHNHGAVSHQIHFGLFGAIITEYPELTKYEEAGCSELYTDGDSAYQTNILVFSSVYAVNTALCTCEQGILDVATLEGSSNAAREGAAAYGRCAEHGKMCFHQYSACYEYCAFEGSRDGSGLDYDVEIEITSDSVDTDGIDQFGLVNGIYNPTITITQSKYRRLQFVNTMHQYYIHYKFPTECTILLLGYDGIFFEYYRNLNEFSNELLLSSGSRADLLIKCDAVDTYEVVTISLDGQSANEESDFDTLERFGSDQDDIDDQKKLFTISVVSEDQGDSISDPPTAIPERPNYLKDLQNIGDSEIDSNCACNQYSGDGSDLCYIHYSSKDLMAVNNEEFSDKDRYLTYMIQDRVYEFNLKTDRHVHHQHVYPFQVMENIGTGGFIAQAGDFFDTMGAESERLVRTHTADFSGYMMLHCHILPHEDEGMMALMYVLSASEAAGTETPSPTKNTLPTEDCLEDLKARQAYSGSSAPAPTVNSGKPSKAKGGSSLFVDFQFNDLNLKQHNGIWIFSIITMFMLLTLCNTCMICQARRRGSTIMGNRMYGVVDEKDIDYIDEDI